MQSNLSEINYPINKVNHKVCYSNNASKQVVRDILKIKNNPNILFIYDENINSKIIRKFLIDLKKIKNKVLKLSVEGGKQNKDKDLLFKIIDNLTDNQFTKNSVILSMGGGVVGDVSSFAAALYMRGTYYFHVPTTMTSILDSCIGGKTAINYKNKINLLGTYYHPYRVYISHDIIKDIPEREYRSGFAEAIKCGIIGDESILKILEKKFNQVKQKNFTVLKNLCLKVLDIKIKFFLNDVREKNKRLNLNFGHTFAHAIEMAGSINKKYQINHGEAVSIGILCEMYYAGTNSKIIKRIINILKRYSLPTKIYMRTMKNDFKNRIFKNLFLDKKRISKYPRYIKILNIKKTSISEIKDFNKAKKIIDNQILKIK